MAWMLTRRAALKAAGAGALVAFATRPFDALADDAVETHGLSSFGDLALPPDFAHFTYVNPDAPTGGLLSLQITGTSGNQNFDTFDTLNIYSWKGDGAAGMGATFDTLMTANGDEPNSVYGLLAQSVRVSGDKLDYRFKLRPEAKFFDGSRVTAADVAFSLNILKDKGHPVYAQLLREVESAVAGGRRRRPRALRQGPQPRRAPHRRRHAGLFRRLVEGPRLHRGHARRPARLRRLQGQDFRAGAVYRVRAPARLFGRQAPGEPRPEQFRPAALRILPRAAGRLRGVQGRRDQLPRGVHLALLGDGL